MGKVKYPELDVIPDHEELHKIAEAFREDHFCHLDSRVNKRFELWDDNLPQVKPCAI